MKIKEITDNAIIFDNDNMITYNHSQDCCENNYADFLSLSGSNINYNFDFDDVNLLFKFVDGAGFMFGSAPINDPEGDVHWIFIPCYSEQNGYYTDEIDIYYTTKERIVIKEETKQVTHGPCERHLTY